MKIPQFNKRIATGFTLTEMMIVVSVLVVILTGMLSGHLFGLKMFQITKAKLGASDEARKAISKLTGEVRAAKWLQVGTNSTAFQEIADGKAQQGNAVEIYSTETTNSFIRYYLDLSDRNLKRITSENPTPTVIAHSISNNVVFAAENSSKMVLTNGENNRVLALTLQFYQIQYPIVKVGPGEFYDFYQLTTRITRRALE